MATGVPLAVFANEPNLAGLVLDRSRWPLSILFLCSCFALVLTRLSLGLCFFPQNTKMGKGREGGGEVAAVSSGAEQTLKGPPEIRDGFHHSAASRRYPSEIHVAAGSPNCASSILRRPEEN